MEQVNQIIENELFKTCIYKIEGIEQDRIYCKHNMEHFMDVARIAYILNLEYSFFIEKKLIYAAALLHDIGKHEQYLFQTPHEEAGSRIGRIILNECGFKEYEIEIIVDAIASHRNKEVAGEKNLRGLLYKSDKLSRACFNCNAKEKCNWDDTKKNLTIIL